MKMVKQVVSKILFVGILLLITSSQSFGQGNNSTFTQIFDSSFRTLRVENPDDFYTLPVIRLNTNDRLVISFDEMGDDFSLLEYRLLHCNFDWTQSSLIDSEFLPSFNSAKVEDYAFSSNTYIHFVNYRIEIPNQQISPLISGNYLLQVYREGEPDDVVLQARFKVSEEAILISGEASAITDRGVNTDVQQLSFAVSSPSIKIRDPFTELIAIVEQNNDPSTSRIVQHPMRLKGNDIIYEHLPELIFPAGNEFRRFETVRADYPGMNIDSVGYQDPMWQAWLTFDYPRDDKQYIYDQTQNGRYMVREYNSTDSDLGADYIMTHFTLDTSKYPNADVYVQGDFSNWLLNPKYKMEYDGDKTRYYLSLPLKQGSYNYRYILLPLGTTIPPAKNRIEGDKYETANEYSVSVYYRTPGSRADRLLGTARIVKTN
ncbi:MAG: DUF5103 domain-containing protein [Prevotella sp.]|nr:DUF5103 domain-containing protein [Bacteroides sp.]MCM1367070.1 DUF5103 domain-containing protein [Prevotella sp.]MCM1437548.1 DUF5103 domain-containing protein [Prevotella sp.]